MLRPKTLQQRLFFFLLLPVAALLLTMGLVVFFYARANLLAQWKEAAVVKLGRAAHDVDMILRRPKVRMEMFHKTGGEPDADRLRRWIVKQLENLEGIERVTITRLKEPVEENSLAGACPAVDPSQMCYTWSRDSRGRWDSSMMESMEFQRAEIADITPPRYDDLVEHETVSLISDLLDKNGLVIGRLEVVLQFQYLIEGALSFGWSREERAFLVDGKGRILACNITRGPEEACYDEALNAAVKALEKEVSGTMIRSAGSHQEVVGFHRLVEAPWSLVVVAQSREILAPIFRFRSIYLSVTAVFFLLILLLIRLIAGRTVASIRDVSNAARRVARGSFDTLLPVKSRDEVGQLILSFNEMVHQLDERIRLKESLDLAMEVQQNLLPAKPPRIEGLDIAGRSIYCDETGGDYYDFLTFPQWDSNRVGIVVGDVAGHGIAAALFMTTVRALLRSRITQPGSLSEVMNDVNRLLCMDTSRTGDFMSLFLALADLRTRTIRWVRAGHAPALVYDLDTDSFEELRGEGAAIGYEESLRFEEYEYTGWSGAKILFLGTDGIWETESPQGEMFGMERLRTLLRSHGRESSEAIIQAVREALDLFRRGSPQEDDVTMVVVKSVTS